MQSEGPKRYSGLEELKSLEVDEFFEVCKGIRYGWMDDKGKIYSAPDYSRYGLQTPEETLRKGYGVCWDQTELQRWWFESKGYKCRTFFLYYYISDDYCPSHSFLAYSEKGKWYWFEPMFHETKVKHCGIYQYAGLESLWQGVVRSYTEVAAAEGMLPAVLKNDRWSFYEYDRPKFGISDREFYAHCRKGKVIDVR